MYKDDGTMNRRLMFSYLTITAFFLLVLEIPLGISFANDERNQVSDGLTRDAKVLAALVNSSLETGKTIDAAIIDNYQIASGARVLVVDESGISVADSKDPIGRNYAPQSEIALALRGKFSTGNSKSPTNEELTYVAAPVVSGEETKGAVRITFASSEINDRIRGRWLTLGALAIIMLAAVAGIGYLITRMLTGPLETLRAAGSAFLVGERDIRVPPGDSPGLNELVTTFNQMADHIESLEESQFDAMVALERSFLDNASGQLRSPLTKLRRNLANLEVTVIPEAREELKAAISQTTRLTTLVGQLLDLATIEATGAGDAENIELVSAITERCEAWQLAANERGVRLRVDSDDPSWSWVAPNALNQILDNLIANAIEVAPTGTAVTIRTEARADFVGIHVIDQGQGMSEEERNLAFDRFWQGPNSERRGTSGLGLTIVSQLAKASNGIAGLSPVPEGGIDAWVQLPHQRADLDAQQMSENS